MKSIKLGIFFISMLLFSGLLPANPIRLNIFDYGAKGDGVTVNTDAFNSAIEACSKSNGGTVVVPKGTFLSGTIILKSNIILFLEEGAIIKGIRDLTKYKTFNKGEEIDRNWFRALILGVDIENITITGKGMIDGDHVFDPEGEENMRGPHAIILGDSKNIIMSGITIINASNYAFLGWRIENATFTNLVFNAGWDGIHIRWGKEISITHCKFYTGDDCIAGGEWQNMTISDNIINSSCNGIRLIMPAINLTIKNCQIFGPGKFEHRTYKEKMRRNTYCGIVLQPGSWGKAPGTMKNITVEDISIDSVENAIMLVLNEDNNAEGILFERIKATNIGLSACSVESWKGSTFGDVTFRDLQITYQGSDSQERANTKLTIPGVDTRSLPCWAWFGYNINKLTFENIKITVKGHEIRPAFIFENIKELNMKNVNYTKLQDKKPAVIKNVEKLNIERVYPALL